MADYSSQSFCTPHRKEGLWREDIAAISVFLQPFEGEVHMLYKAATSLPQGKTVVSLAGHYQLQQLAMIIDQLVR